MSNTIPHLIKQGTATQLIVDDQPYLIIGGELHNSSASSMAYMQPIWERLKALHLNTVLAVVSWELVEPKEGTFDFTLVSELIYEARHHGLRLILLWFGTWKNGMSSYAPSWVKRDYHRFPRVKINDGETIEILSTFSTETRDADARAFSEFMRHLKAIDRNDHTVIMVQVQNEVGVLGDSRDRSAMANEAFVSDVPAELMHYLQEHQSDLGSDLYQRWQSSDFKTSGNWEAIFGNGMETDEIFMAWHYARYIETVTSAGKAEYPLPMFVNAWLSSLDTIPGGWASGGHKPGEWPSGGPLPHTFDIWRTGAPSIDFMTPDIYQPNFQAWCQEYTRPDNPLFIPEMKNNIDGAYQVFYAIGEHDAIGVSPFGIDSVEPSNDNPLKRSYLVLRQLAPIILEHQGRHDMIGFLLNEQEPTITRQLGGYELTITLDEGFGQSAKQAGGLIIATGTDQFLGAGFGFRVQFKVISPRQAQIGIVAVEEGTYQDGKWIPGRRLNGDEAGRGHWWRFYDYESADGRPYTNDVATGISRCSIYIYE